MKNREKLIQDLKNLYQQNLDFLASVANGTCPKKYHKETIKEFKKLNAQLSDYIEDVSFGLERDKSLSDWRDLFGDVLLGDEDLDDDNFPRGGW